MKHLVLGSEGQVGQYVVKQLEADGIQAIRWDIALGEKYDLRNKSKELLDVMGEVDYVHYLASDVGGSAYLASYQDTYDFIQNNVEIMDTVFSALKWTQKPFYFTSSQMSTMSHSTYGRLKAVGESYTTSLDRQGKVVWFWNVYGLETDTAKAHVITDFLRMAKEDNRIICKTTGHEKRQFAYGKDVATILCDISYKPDSLYFAPLHITSGEWTTIREVAQMVTEAVGVPCEMYFGLKEDKIQGIVNEPFVPDYQKRKFRPLKKGIFDLYVEMYYRKV